MEVPTTGEKTALTPYLENSVRFLRTEKGITVTLAETAKYLRQYYGFREQCKDTMNFNYKSAKL